MSDPRDDRASDEPDDGPASATDAYTDTGVPRWVRVFGAVALLVVIAVVLLMAAGGGNHGPSRHMRSGDDNTPTSFTRHTAPAGGHAP